ncbi:MAG: ATP-binding cassette domain-containing protein [Bacillota bacterium]|nr:ATP-binding cassette domain-containing protein [Bacillota bacterium]
MLSVNLTKKYDNKVIKTNFNLSKGEILVLMGENGVGKSTILNMISGIVKPDIGEILFDGEVIYSSDKNTNKDVSYRKIGYITQKNCLFSHFNIIDNITIGLKISKEDEQLNRYLDEFSLNKMINKYPHEISGGQKQRVAIVRALIRNPKILLMDEAFSSIDEFTKRCLRQKTKDLVHEKNIPLIFVTHDSEEAKFMSSKILYLN